MIRDDHHLPSFDAKKMQSASKSIHFGHRIFSIIEQLDVAQILIIFVC